MVSEFVVNSISNIAELVGKIIKSDVGRGIISVGVDSLWKDEFKPPLCLFSLSSLTLSPASSTPSFSALCQPLAFHNWPSPEAGALISQASQLPKLQDNKYLFFLNTQSGLQSYTRTKRTETEVHQTKMNK